MEKAKRERVKEVFYSALKRPVNERGAYLERVCSDDEEFKNDVEILLNSYDSGFLEDNIWPDSITERTLPFPCFSPGTEFSHYEIIKLIGRGGMGEVYLARDRSLDRQVAIKIIHDDSHQGANAEKRLLREARSAAGLDHPNICSVYEVGESSSRPFIAMQYIEGDTLHEILKNGPIQLGEAISIVRNIASALAEAHSRGIIHRDIKPSNIIIDGRGQLRVLDFGLAKSTLLAGPNSRETDLSEDGIVAGTIEYMSPEQARGETVDSRTDIWSLGVVFYQLITGRVPFRGTNKVDTIAAIIHREFVPASRENNEVSSSVDEVIKRALEKVRHDRFTSIAEFDEALEKLADQSTLDPVMVHGSPSNPGQDVSEQAPSRVRMTPPFWLIATAILLLLSVSLIYPIYWLVESRRSERPFSVAHNGRLKIAKIFSTKRPSKGMLTDVSYSPDGRLMAFLLMDAGNSAVYVMQTSGGTPVPITDGKWFDQTPVWSPDGQRIAFVSNRENKVGIWAIPYMGGTPVLQTLVREDSTKYQLRKWSNDGKYIYFESGSDLRQLDLNTGQSSKFDFHVTDGEIEGGYSISADEKMVAFVATQGERRHILTQLLRGQGARRIEQGDMESWSPHWFPDGDQLAFTSDRNGNIQIFVSDLDGNGVHPITFGDSVASDPVVSPDGRKIAFVSIFDQANIFSLDTITSKETAVTNSVGLLLFPGISPKGDKVTYQATDDDYNLYSSPLFERFLHDPAEANLDIQGCCAKWSPLGDRIAFIKSAGTERDIWSLDPLSFKSAPISSVGVSKFGNAVAPYNFLARLFDWSPDGRFIAFASKRSGQNNIWRVDSDGKNEMMVTDYRSPNSVGYSPIWSRDGRKIAFIEAIGSGPPSLSEENRIGIIDGGTTYFVANTQGITRLLGWADNDASVIIAAKRNSSVEIQVADVANTVGVESIGFLPEADIHGIGLTPDGRNIVYSARIGNLDDVYLFPSAGGKPRKLTSNSDSALFYSGFAWSSDSKKLYYSKQTGGMRISQISDQD